MQMLPKVTLAARDSWRLVIQLGILIFTEGNVIHMCLVIATGSDALSEWLTARQREHRIPVPPPSQHSDHAHKWDIGCHGVAVVAPRQLQLLAPSEA
jgi:hypothetical protein